MCMPNFMFTTLLFLEILGQKGSKRGVFGRFSKNNGWIWFILLGKEDIIVLRVHAKFHDQNTSGSWDIGAKVVKKKGFTVPNKSGHNSITAQNFLPYYGIFGICMKFAIDWAPNELSTTIISGDNGLQRFCIFTSKRPSTILNRRVELTVEKIVSS